MTRLMLHQMRRLGRPQSFSGAGPVALLASIGAAMTLVPVASSAATRPPSLGRPTKYALGRTPTQVVTGDLTGDGKPELVIGALGAVSVLVNEGDGTFGARRDYARGAYHDSVALGDLNHDGRLDLIVTNLETISVMLGNGNGTFQSGRTYSDRSEVVSVAVGDLNGDGSLDVVTANEGENGAVAIFNGNGDGTLQARRVYVTRTDPAQVSVEDLNDDGRPDLAIYNEHSGETGENTVSVFTNGGGGSFVRRNYRTADTPRAFAIGDLNGDSKPDLAVTNELANAVSVLTNKGDGTFRPKRDFATGPLPDSIAIGDLNGDDAPDLAVGGSSTYDETTLFVHLGEGGGRFEPRLEYGPGGTSSSVAIDDFDADGKPDLAVATRSVRTVSVLIGKPGLCTVQDVARMTPSAAKRLITRAGCAVGQIRRAYSRGPDWQRVRRGLVMRQNPKPGRVLPNGGKVDLVVSLGRKR